MKGTEIKFFRTYDGAYRIGFIKTSETEPTKFESLGLLRDYTKEHIEEISKIFDIEIKE